MYALEKLSDSMQLLVAGEGDARSRVSAASRYFFRVVPEWLPAEGEMRPRFRAAIALLTKYKPPEFNNALPDRLRDTDFTYTMRRIRNSTAARAASELFGVWLELSEAYYAHERRASSQAKRGGFIIDDIP